MTGEAFSVDAWHEIQILEDHGHLMGVIRRQPDDGEWVAVCGECRRVVTFQTPSAWWALALLDGHTREGHPTGVVFSRMQEGDKLILFMA